MNNLNPKLKWQRNSAISDSIEETCHLRNESKISAEEFTYKLEENKDKLEEALHESPAMLETKKIIQDRISMVSSLVKKQPRTRTKKGKKPKKKQ